MKRLSRRINAFSILELIIIIAIIGLLVSITVASYGTFQKQQKVEAQAKAFADVLELAKNKAAAGDVAGLANCKDSVGTDFERYRVRLTSPTYDLSILCDGSWTTINTYRLESGIVFQSNTTIYFNPLAQGATNTTVNVINTNNTLCVPVEVSATGLIDVKPRVPGC